MLRDLRSRVRLFIAVLGCAVLLTSFLSWALSLHAAEERNTWVKVDPSRVPLAATAELWHVSATCVRPYFVRAALRSKAKLEAHYNAAPAEVRARLSARTDPPQSPEPAAWHPAQSTGQKQAARSDLYGEYAAALQVKYAEWYAALFKLEIEAGKWQRRLLDIGDQTILLSATSRASFGASSGGDLKLTGPQGDFEDSLLAALGLGGLSSDEQMSLKSACLTIDPVIQRLQTLTGLFALWRWPVDCLAEFSFGLELVLISIFFTPIAGWLGVGLPEPGPHSWTLTDRLGTSIRDLPDSAFASGLLAHARRMYLASLAMAVHGSSYAAGRWAFLVAQRPRRGAAGARAASIERTRQEGTSRPR